MVSMTLGSSTSSSPLERIAGRQFGTAGGQSLGQVQMDRLLAVDVKEAAAAGLRHGAESLAIGPGSSSISRCDM